MSSSGTIKTITLPNGNTYDVNEAMTGATSSVAGASGLVPAPSAGDDTKFLRGDGTWAEASGGGEVNTVDFSIATTDWTLSSGMYTASVSDSGFSASSEEKVKYNSSILNLSSGLNVDKDGTTYDIVFTTKKLPIGTITGTILSFVGELESATGVNF